MRLGSLVTMTKAYAAPSTQGVTPMLDSYLEYVRSWSEVAFAKWRSSGYRDIAAHDEWLRLRAEWQRAKVRQAA